MRKFAIFYEDGSVIEGGGGDLVEIVLKAPRAWLNAPSDGVQAVVFEKDDGSIGHANSTDYYFPMHPELNHCSDLSPFLHVDLKGFMKFGASIPRDEYERIQKIAKDYNWETYQKIIKPYTNGRRKLG